VLLSLPEKGGERRMMNQRGVLLLTSMTVTILLASGVAFAANFIDCSANPCFGTDGDDFIFGHQSGKTSDQIYGYGGHDYLYGYGGDDILVGDGQDNPSLDGDDIFYGGDGNDSLYGYGGFDVFYGEAGSDFIDARENSPRPTTKPANDSIYAGGGNDLIYANDGYSDYIDCGGGKKDKVYYDIGEDTVLKNCEKKFPQL
jgi:Ca2+-binding RTX toxin-like protein